MISLLLAFLFALLVAVFAVQNLLPVTVTFLWWSVQTSLVIVILGMATFGALVIFCLAGWVQFRLRRRLQTALNRQGQLERENQELKTRIEPDACQRPQAE